MASRGGGSGTGDDNRQSDGQTAPSSTVADLMQRLNLTEEEGGVTDFSDEEEAGAPASVECALLGKVLSPSALHANTIRAAMTPAWGNPHGLKIRSIGERGDNLFVAEFGSKIDLDRVLAGTP